MKTLFLTIVGTILFVSLKFLRVFFSALSNVLNYLAQLIEERVELCQRISAYILQRNECEEILGASGATEPLFSHDEILEMAQESFKKFNKIPRLVDLESFYAISNRQALKIRNVIVKEFEAQTQFRNPSPLNIFRYSRLTPAGASA